MKTSGFLKTMRREEDGEPPTSLFSAVSHPQTKHVATTLEEDTTRNNNSKKGEDDVH
jgi:hypothetical protein